MSANGNPSFKPDEAKPIGSNNELPSFSSDAPVNNYAADKAEALKHTKMLQMFSVAGGRRKTRRRRKRKRRKSRHGGVPNITKIGLLEHNDADSILAKINEIIKTNGNWRVRLGQDHARASVSSPPNVRRGNTTRALTFESPPRHRSSQEISAERADVGRQLARAEARLRAARAARNAARSERHAGLGGGRRRSRKGGKTAPWHRRRRQGNNISSLKPARPHLPVYHTSTREFNRRQGDRLMDDMRQLTTRYAGHNLRTAKGKAAAKATAKAFERSRKGGRPKRRRHRRTRRKRGGQRGGKKPSYGLPGIGAESSLCGNYQTPDEAKFTPDKYITVPQIPGGSKGVFNANDISVNLAKTLTQAKANSEGDYSTAESQYQDDGAKIGNLNLDNVKGMNPGGELIGKEFQNEQNADMLKMMLKHTADHHPGSKKTASGAASILAKRTSGLGRGGPGGIGNYFGAFGKTMSSPKRGGRRQRTRRRRRRRRKSRKKKHYRR
jgi:hypothetical protein